MPSLFADITAWFTSKIWAKRQSSEKINDIKIAIRSYSNTLQNAKIFFSELKKTLISKGYPHENDLPGNVVSWSDSIVHEIEENIHILEDMLNQKSASEIIEGVRSQYLFSEDLSHKTRDMVSGIILIKEALEKKGERDLSNKVVQEAHRIQEGLNKINKFLPWVFKL